MSSQIALQGVDLIGDMVFIPSKVAIKDTRNGKEPIKQLSKKAGLGKQLLRESLSSLVEHFVSSS